MKLIERLNLINDEELEKIGKECNIDKAKGLVNFREDFSQRSQHNIIKIRVARVKTKFSFLQMQIESMLSQAI